MKYLFFFLSFSLSSFAAITPDSVAIERSYDKKIVHLALTPAESKIFASSLHEFERYSSFRETDLEDQANYKKWVLKPVGILLSASLAGMGIEYLFPSYSYLRIGSYVSFGTGLVWGASGTLATLAARIGNHQSIR